MLQPSMFAGVADQAATIKLRQMGVNVRDGLATDRAIDEIWKAVDSDVVRPMIVRGRPREIIRLDPAITKPIPTLRFMFLRPSNPRPFTKSRDGSVLVLHHLGLPGDIDSKIDAQTDAHAAACLRRLDAAC
jgi:hypothetical protein